MAIGCKCLILKEKVLAEKYGRSMARSVSKYGNRESFSTKFYKKKNFTSLGLGRGPAGGGWGSGLMGYRFLRSTPPMHQDGACTNVVR